MADVCLLVVRPEYTQKEMFERTLNEIAASGTKGVSLVINDLPMDGKHYGYGEKYGYSDNKKSDNKSKSQARKD